MDALTTMCSNLWLSDVQTYIQSGNIIFMSAEPDTTRLIDMISYGIMTQFGLDIVVQIRTATEWKQIISQCRYAKPWDDINDLYVTLLATAPIKVALKDLIQTATESEKVSLIGQTLYLRTPAYGTTKISNAMIERKLKASATTRNWKTVVKLGEMIG